MTSPCSARRSRKGARGLMLSMPWSSRIGPPCVHPQLRRNTSSSMRLTLMRSLTGSAEVEFIRYAPRLAPRPSSRSCRGSRAPPHILVKRLKVLQLREHLFGGEREALLRLRVGDQALARHHDDMADAADPAPKLLDLLCHGVGVAGKHLALCNQRLSVEIGRTRPPGRVTAPSCGRHLRGDRARLELRELRRALDADGQEPSDLLADSNAFLVGVADIAECHVGKPVLVRRRKRRLDARLLIGLERLAGAVIASEQQGIDHAAT